MKSILIKDGRIMAYDFDYKGIDSIYNLLGFDCFDVATRTIGGHKVSIYCDDEGCFKTPLVPSIACVDKDGTIQNCIFGNVLIVNHDYDGNMIGLTSKELLDVYSSQGVVKDDNGLHNVVVARC